MGKRIRIRVTLTLDPTLYKQAKEKKLVLSSLLDKIVMQELNPVMTDAYKQDVEYSIKELQAVRPIQEGKKNVVYAKAVYECDICGSRVEGQYRLMLGKAYCGVCGRVLNSVV